MMKKPLRTPVKVPPVATGTHWQPQFWLQHPGFAAVASVAAQVCDWTEWPMPAAYYEQLSTAAPVRFVGVETLSYEDHVAETGEVPTRYASWHDLFNALIWHQYPNSKAALNRLHQQAKLLVPVEGQRGRRRDAATLFDENGAMVFSDDPALLALIRAMDWPSLFLQHRQAFGRTLHIHLFGHGLLDQLRQPFLGLTAHALLLQLPVKPLVAKPEALDLTLAAAIDAAKSDWTPADLAPLPILGIPGWWPDNDRPEFYDNRNYFRRERRRQLPAGLA